MTQNTETLARKAADIAMQGAAAYLASRGALRTVDADKLCAALRVHVGVAMLPALADARAAYAANMPQVAVATFAASLQLAGIDAAKEYLTSALDPRTARRLADIARDVKGAA